MFMAGNTTAIKLYASLNQAGIDVYYDWQNIEERLGGLGSTTEFTVILELPVEPSKVDLALLDISQLAPATTLSKWRLWVNNVTVTREFKPSVSAKLDNGLTFSKAVYDLKPIIDSLRQQRYKVSIQYEGSPEVSLEAIGFLIVYRAVGSRAYIDYYSGASVLAPGDKLTLPIGDGAGREAEAIIAVYVPNKLSRIKLTCGENIKTISNVIGLDTFAVNCIGAEELSIEYLRPDTPIYPRTAIVSSVLVKHVERPEPSIKLETSLSDDELMVSMRNDGGAAPEKLLLILISRGQVIERMLVDPLKPGESKAFSIKLSGRPRPTAVRAVWKYRGETSYIERKL